MCIKGFLGDFLGGFGQYHSRYNRVYSKATEILSKVAPGIEVPIASVKNQTLGGDLAFSGLVARATVITDLQTASCESALTNRPKISRLDWPGSHLQDSDPPTDLVR